ncbi:hypothetical protein [Psychromonas sp. MME2]|uniref:hypothetical protein n=1 Tax=unclassified Psychromonas TaxID=2614957 RepID=UPI00339BF035
MNVEKKGVRTEIVKKDRYAARFVASKKVDGMINVAFSMSPIIAELGLSKEIELTNVRFGPVDFHLMMSKKSPYVSLMPEIDRALQKLKDNDQFTKIFAKYSVDSSTLVR